MELKHVLNKEGIQKEAARYAIDHIEGQADDDLDETALEEIAREMLKRSRQPNISFFAFTATPKYKTKKVFDEPGPDGESPFHKYTMKQAIEEKFIHDVLKNFTHIDTYFKLLHTAEDDPQVERKKTTKALGRFLSLHDYNIRQKTEMMVEHFRHQVRHKIGGRAKAMVVTGSRLHAVHYKESFDSYISEMGYDDVKSLVAFSGTVNDPKFPEKSWTEVSMNKGTKESELPDRF
jgi:type I restriction enzyme R subunit